MSYSPNFRGSNSKGSAKSLMTGYQNASGSTLAMATPVSTNGIGQLITIDVSNEDTVSALLGVTSSSIPNSANGLVIDAGRLENVTGLSASVGDPLYISKTGSLTNIKPNVGDNGFLAGDFVIFIGVVVSNEFIPANKDIKLMIQLIGQL